MKNVNLITNFWPDYELLDSGDNAKLERYGKYVVSRPETQAIWRPLHPEKWNKADAEFKWAEGKGGWKISGTSAEKRSPDQELRREKLLSDWQISFKDAKFALRLTSFKHTGIFPEQEPNWTWLAENIKKLEQPKVLNLFGYTGAATVLSALAGAQVTHADASKKSNDWAKENAELSGVPQGSVRYILDDALRFAEREVRREEMYEGIILDPPAFGRGAKGEVWRIEEDLPRLLNAASKLLSPRKGSFFLLNGYAAGYSPLSLMQLVKNYFPKAEGEYGELRIPESGSERFIPEGIYVRFLV